MTTSRPTFLSIREPLKTRFRRFTPVTPDGKAGAQQNWNNFQLISDELATRYAGPGTKFEFFNVGIVSPGEGSGNLCFLDPDVAGILPRIEKETGEKFPAGYAVCTRPKTDSSRCHRYFLQTPYSVRRFREYFEARARRQGKRFEGTKNINVKSLTEFNETGGYLNLYDMKGIGGASLVVSEGSVRLDGQRYTCIDPDQIPRIPNWLVEWVIQDFEKFEVGKEAIRRERDAEKTAARSKYSPEQRRQLRRKNEIDGFDVNFEDKYDFLRSRSFTYTAMGLSQDLVEKALIEQATDFVHGGRAWVETEKALETIHKLVTNSDLHRGDADWFYRDELKRWDGDEPTLVIQKSVRSPRYEAMLMVMDSFPSSIHKDAAYTRLESDLRDMGYEFDRSLNADQVATAAARKRLGFDARKPIWIRSPEGNDATQGSGEA